jgi:tetratricopeptide (TPR) repeat protein
MYYLPNARRLLAVVSGLIIAMLLNGSAYAPAQTAPQKTVCQADLTPITDADNALYKYDLIKAEELNGKQLKNNPNYEEARAQLIHVMLLRGKIADAEAMAKEFLAAKPNSSTAETAMTMVFYRKGNIPDAYKHVTRALALNPCNGRAHRMLGRIYALTLMQNSARQQIMTAHALKPTDDEIYFLWLLWMPKREQVAAISDYMAHNPYYDKTDTILTSTLEKAKAPATAPPFPCKAVSAVQNTQLPLQPMFTDTTPDSHRFASIEYIETKGPQNANYPIRGWALDIYLNGKRHRMQLSTSHSGLVLTQVAAERMKLTWPQAVPGSVYAPKAQLDSVRIGDLEFQNCGAEVLGNISLPNDVDGTIGMSVFRNYIVSMDAPARKLSLAPLTPLPGQSEANSFTLQTAAAEDEFYDRYIPPGMENWTRVYRTAQLWLLPTRIDTGQERLFALDTSSTYSFIDLEVARTVTKVKPLPGIFFHDDKGKLQPQMAADQVTLVFAGIKQSAQNIFAKDFSSESDLFKLNIAGQLGLQSFPNMIINLDYRDGLIQFVPEK